MGGAAVMSFVVLAGQQAVGHVPRKLAADAAAAAEADALVFGFKIGAVVDVAPAQRAGVESVFICGGSAANHRAIQPGMLADGDVIAAFAGKDARLLHYRIVVAVHLVLAEVDAGGAAHGAKGEAASGAGVLLSGVVAVAVLLGGEGQVAADIGDNRVAADLGAGEGGVAPAVEDEIVTGIDGGFAVGGAVAAFAAFALVGAGGDADPPAAGADPNPDADCAAVAVVFAFQQRGVSSRDQVQVAFVVGNAEVVLYLR